MITVVGSLNMDLFIETPRLPAPGETILGRRFRQAPGGKGANQACAAARLGAVVSMIGAVGADAFGREMVGNLAKFGAGTDGIITRPKTPTGVAFILVDDSGQNQIVVASGSNATLTARDIETQAGLLQSSQAVITQLEIPIEAVAAALAIGRRAGALTILNPAPCAPLSDELLRLCDWIIPNELEAGQLAGIPLHDPAGAARVASALRQRSPRTGIVITLGAHGAWLECDGESTLIPAFAVEAIDTVGAGDTFVGAFATRIVEGASPRVAARFAAAAAALAVTKRGAQSGLPSRREVNLLVDSIDG